MEALQNTEFTNIANQLTYNSEKFTSKVILEKGEQKTILFAFAKGQGLKTHTSPTPVMVIAVEGACYFSIYGEEQYLSVGEVVLIPANEPHALTATIDFKMVLIK